MVIHPIHDLSNKYAIGVLSRGLAKIRDSDIQPNYHPDFHSRSGNLFKILEEGRYRFNSGTYYVLEEDGELISCAGWNDYPVEPGTALILTRMYVNPQVRGQFTVGKYILPVAFGESMTFNHRLWMTFGQHNQKYERWFKNDSPLIPPLYKKFLPVGKKNIYFTEQSVYEYVRPDYL